MNRNLLSARVVAVALVFIPLDFIAIREGAAAGRGHC